MVGTHDDDGSTMTIEMRLGRYQAAVDTRLAAWDDGAAADRLWSGDPSLWGRDTAIEIEDRLGWLDLPTAMRRHLPDLTAFADDVRGAGIRDVVLLGMGGSSLAPEVFQRTFGNRPGYPALTVLDSTHPGAVAAVVAAVDPASTLFLVSSKSGTTIEPLSFLEFLWAVVATATDRPGEHFAAVTDPGSHLEGMAAERGFRRTFTADPNVGGRYSALTHFGLVPAALIGADLAALLDEAGAGADASRAGRGGLPLGAALGELARAGRDKATFLTSRAFAAFPAWVEQLIAESTGKDGTGILPIADELPGTGDAYGDDRLFVSLALGSDDTGDLDAFMSTMEAAGHPVIRIVVDRPEALAGEMYRAEIATAMAGSVLGIHPFDQPDVQAAKVLANQAMAGQLDAGAIDEVPADGPGLEAAVDRLLEAVTPGDYLALQAFLPATGNTTAALQRIRHLARDRLGVATTLGFGPRFLHSTGQLHKGGPNTGVFLQIVDHPGPHLDVPGQGYTFGALIAGQADGDHQALTAAGRRVMRVCLGDDVPGGLAALERALEA